MGFNPHSPPALEDEASRWDFENAIDLDSGAPGDIYKTWLKQPV
jgi:hypothetical protein